MRRKQGSFKKFVNLSLLALLVGGLVYLYNSAMFEQKKPTIEVEDELYWNFKKSIPISVYDDSGIRFVRVTLSDGKNNLVLSNVNFKDLQKEVNIEAKYPRTAFFDEKSNLTLSIEATDNSRWNFFMGNEARKDIAIKIDTKKPRLNVVANSYSIVKGGVGTVVFSASDANLDKLYIKTSSHDIFKPSPFYKDGYYISYVVWRYNQDRFSASIVATDKAGNEIRKRIKFYPLSKKYKVSNIRATDKFIDGKITDLVNEYASEKADQMNNKEKFRFINETLRGENEDKIHAICSVVEDTRIDNLSLKAFYPLKYAAAVASFGDHRFYKYKNKPISESYHLGLDLASVSHANIVSSNDGIVVFAKENGIYGNNIIISHGLGLYSIYGHCSSLLVEKGDFVNAGDVIAKTGLTGLALGDHLHFGTLVQGIEVRPEEWMDQKWIVDNVLSVLKDAKRLIDGK